MSLDNLIENIELCPVCGEKHEYSSVQFVEDLAYVISNCVDCNYENRMTINHIIQI
jgi:formate dehydrogenase maturation protein FdhE